MCATCGCGADEVRVTVLDDHPPNHGHDHDHAADHEHHAHAHDHTHDHDPDHAHGSDGRRTHTLTLEQAVLAKNDDLATVNREWMAGHGLTAINLMSSPGAGKTTVLERTIAEAGLPISVIEGDQETVLDAQRIRAAGARTVQVNTGAGCHLDAAMVRQALTDLRPDPGLVVIENVGNLVCPALFDLGEGRRVVLVSVTEGEDKPRKYPHMFAAADLIVINKSDLLPYVDFSVERFTAAARSLRPGVQVLCVSAKTGHQLDAWYAWLRTV